MKTNYYKLKCTSRAVLAFCLVFTVLFSSCKKDNVKEEIEDQPFFELKDNPTSLKATSEGITQTYTVKSNSNWKVEPQAQADWININPNQGSGDGTFTITVTKNITTTARTVSLGFSVAGKLQSNLLKIEQEGMKEEEPVEEDIVFSEDFSWLTYGNAIFYNVDGEIRFDNWTEEERAKGWTSTVNAVEKSGGTPLLYARPGFVKLGKTSYGGDLISPKLSKVTGAQDLVVTFKAVPYKTATGTQDATILKVNVIGPGTINTGEFNIDNWPDFDTDPNCTEIWKASTTERSFTITGATAETQIRFLGQDFDLRLPDVDPNKNRIFLDDIKVTVKK